MNHRRPVSARAHAALPSLLALVSAGWALHPSDALAQPARPPAPPTHPPAHPPAPPPAPPTHRPPVHPPPATHLIVPHTRPTGGAPRMVNPHPVPPVTAPTVPSQPPPLQVEGGRAKVSALPAYVQNLK